MRGPTVCQGFRFAVRIQDLCANRTLWLCYFHSDMSKIGAHAIELYFWTRAKKRTYAVSGFENSRNRRVAADSYICPIQRVQTFVVSNKPSSFIRDRARPVPFFTVRENRDILPACRSFFVFLNLSPYRRFAVVNGSFHFSFGNGIRLIC